MYSAGSKIACSVVNGGTNDFGAARHRLLYEWHQQERQLAE